MRVAIDGVTESQLPKELVKAATIIDRRIGQSFCSPQVSLTFVVDCDKSNPYNSDVVKNLTAARDFANQLSILAAK